MSGNQNDNWITQRRNQEAKVRNEQGQRKTKEITLNKVVDTVSGGGTSADDGNNLSPMNECIGQRTKQTKPVTKQNGK